MIRYAIRFNCNPNWINFIWILSNSYFIGFYRWCYYENQNENKKVLVGIISEKDIANKLGSAKYGNMAPSHFHVSTVMVKDLITVDEDDDVTEVAKILIDKNIGAIPVLSDGEMVGIVTKSDHIFMQS